MSTTQGSQTAGPGQVLVTVGDISCTQTDVILPNGRFPIRGTLWTTNNQVTVSTKTPTWAIVVAIVGFFVICVFSLFFLLAKETALQGFVQVTVQGPGFLHTSNVRVSSEAQLRDVEARVAYIRSLVTALG